jgi:hypothetical protein
MFAVNLALGNSVWRLLYKDEEKAQAAMEMTSTRNGSMISLEDDFGQKCYFPLSELQGSMYEDLDKAKMANVELFLHQQRVQVMATKAAQSDPGLRASSMMNGPAVLSPMGGMRQN